MPDYCGPQRWPIVRHLVPDGPWSPACHVHDVAYGLGGTREDRLEADRALRDGIAATGHPVIAQVYFIAVRATGWAFWGR